MKKLGVKIFAFNEEKNIIPVIRQFEGIEGVRVIATISSKPWYGDVKPDKTADLARSTGIEVFEDYWETETEQHDFGMDQLQDCAYVLVSHADTFFTREDIKKMVDFIQTATERQYDMRTYMYWKNLNTVVIPDPLLPAMIIRSDVRFKYGIIIQDQIVSAPLVPDVICHHLSWAKTDKEVLKKITTYTHANEIVPDWYGKVWLADVTEDLSPTFPSDYKGLREHSCPDEIRSLFNGHNHSDSSWCYVCSDKEANFHIGGIPYKKYETA